MTSRGARACNRPATRSACDPTGLGAIHDERKPAMCGVVPLDPRLPQAAQVVVLARWHRESAFLDADCIAPRSREGFERLVDGDRTVDAAYLAAFERYRALLQVEDELWGHDLLEWMRPELARLSPSTRPDGYLALSLVLVLAVLARRSIDWHERRTRYARQQVTLIEATVVRAVERCHSVLNYWNATSAKPRSFRLCSLSPEPRSSSSARMPMRRCCSTRSR
jgi:hypothetical protein